MDHFGSVLPSWFYSALDTNPRFSEGFCCGSGSVLVYCVVLPRAPRPTVKYASGTMSRAPCIHARLHSLARKPGEKCGLMDRSADVSGKESIHGFPKLTPVLLIPEIAVAFIFFVDVIHIHLPFPQGSDHLF